MKRLIGVVLANGQTAEGAEMFKVRARVKEKLPQRQVTESVMRQDCPTPNPSLITVLILPE